MGHRFLGLIVNPIAGMGGSVGLHGTDGHALTEARRRGAQPLVDERVSRALGRLGGEQRLLTSPGPMGAEVVRCCGLRADSLDLNLDQPTTALDTERSARALAVAGCALVLFAGGDGTARDVVRGAGSQVPVLGIPSGVKMHSGVFATSPEAAGEIAAGFLRQARRAVASAELLDVVCPGQGEQLFALATVPDVAGHRLPGPKVSAFAGSSAELEALAEAVAVELQPGTLYLFGPGSTTGRILAHRDLASTPLGVDAVLDGALVGADMSEDEILALMDRCDRTILVLGVVGGQGFLLGRGNQQLGPRALSRLDPEDLIIVASGAKLAALDQPVLRVDTGPEPEAYFAGYHRIRVGPRRSVMMRVMGPT